MTVQVVSLVSTKQESSCSLRKAEQLMDILSQAALIQHIKRATDQAGHCWAQMMIAAPEHHHQVNGVGEGRLREAGKYAGQLYLRPHKPVGNSYAVVARRAAEDAASVKRLLCGAPLFVWWTLH